MPAPRVAPAPAAAPALAPAPVLPPLPGPALCDVGGLRPEIRQLREMVELPLRHPGLLLQLGIQAPRGVLLHGPPGTGKTLLVRAVAQETGAALVAVSAAEILHHLYGESEARLRSLFAEAARRAPAILFLDEIEAIASRRRDAPGEVERRVVAQLLALMDGPRRNEGVVVIGATNLPDLIDPALRRPGRFDRELVIGIPDATARREILEIHSRRMPLDPDVDLGDLAGITHGFVGADLSSLCREAGLAALRRVAPDLESVGAGTAYVPSVTMADFLVTLRTIRPAVLRGFSLAVPDVSWDEVAGVEHVKRELQEAVEWPLRHGDLLRQAAVRPVKGILLHGPPGNGKTLLARALASRSGLNFIGVKGPELLSRYVGESERAVRDVFQTARQAAPCIVFFDEIDALAPSRTAEAGDGGVGGRVLTQILTEMDGVEELSGVVVVAATNRPDLLDPALLRPGRLDLVLEVPSPDETARARIFEVHLKRRPIEAGVDASELARQAEGLTGADIETACRRAGLMAVRRFLAGPQPAVPSLTVLRHELIAAIEERKVMTGAVAQ